MLRDDFFFFFFLNNVALVLNDDLFKKSNANEAFNADEKIVSMKCLTLMDNLSDKNI